MPKAIQTTLRCPNCGQPFNAVVQNYVDVSQEPDKKIHLLSGRLNTAQCPNCGTVTAVASPMLYHDPSKELLIAHVPMELNLNKDQHEKVIGDLLRELPKENFKGYMFNPRRALTVQNLIDQILEADGVTPEMMEQQRNRVRLVQMFLEADEESLPGLVQQYDSQIDAAFFQTFTLMAQRALQEGRSEAAEQVLLIQQEVAERSSYGQRVLAQQAQQEENVREVAEDINALGKQAQRSDFLELAIRYADNDQKLQALVGLVRPAFDYTFLQELTVKIGQAPAADREALEALRDRLLELTAAVDQQAQLALRQAAGLLQAILTNPNPDEVIAANISLIDDTFMAVLAANIQEAERQKDIKASARLKSVYEKVIAILQQNMQPELRFVNELLSTASEDEARALIQEQASQFGPQLIEVMDGVEQVLAGQGDQEMVEKLAFLRRETLEALN